MKIRKHLAALALTAAVIPLAACGAATASDSAASTTSTSSSATMSTESSSTDSSSTDSGAPAPAAAPGGGSAGGGPGGGVDVSSVTTEAELIALVQESYGDPSLDLHRGHRPVEDVLNAVLPISHEELHVYMEEQGINLAAVAEEVDVDPQTLIDALVESRTAAIDAVLAAGEITEDEAEQYRAALEEAFTFRVTWDGQAATPSFTGLS